MAGPVRIAIIADTRDATKGFKTVSDDAKGMGKSLSGVGGLVKGAFVAAGAAVAASGIVEGFKTTISAAADLQAAMGSTNQIFKANAKGMIAWSKNAATTLGLSQAEALNATKTFGSFFTSVGIGTKEAAGMSQGWATMAANMAAFADLPTQDAIDSIAGALRGELDPLQKYIPTINAAAIETKALAMTHKKGAKALTQHDKALAINALLMESVANKAGEAERKQGGYGVQMEKLKAQMKDAAAAIGSAFLPSITKAAKWLNDVLIPAVKEFWSQHGPKIIAIFKTIGTVLATAFDLSPAKALFDLLSGGGGKLGFLSDSVSSIGDSLKELATSDEAQAIVTKFKEGFESLKEPVMNFVNTVRPIIAEVVAFLAAKFQEYLPQIKATLTTIGQVVGQVFEFIKITIQNATSVISFIWQNFGSNILSVIGAAFGSVVSFLQGAFQIIKGVFDIVIGVLTGDWSRAWDGVKGVVRGVVTILRGTMNAMKALVSSAVSVIGRVLSAGWNAVKSVTSSVWGAIKGFFSSIWGSITAVVAGAVGRVRAAISAAWSAVRAATSAAWAGIRNAVSSAIGGVVSVVAGMAGRIRGAISGAASWLYGVGQDIVQGMINGIGSMVSSLVGKAKDLAGSAINAAKSALGIGSPSKEFIKIGKFVAQGFIIGLTTTIPKIVSTMEKLATIVKDAFKGSRESSWLKRIKKDTASLTKLANARIVVVGKLKTQQSKLKSLLSSKAEVIADVRDTFSQSFTLVDQAAQDGDTSIRKLLERSGEAVANAAVFARQLRDLRAKGLNPAVLQELAAAGPEAGAATARALLDASKSQLDELSNNYKQLAKSGTSAGAAIGGAMYDAGINGVRNLIKALTSRQKDLDAAALKIAQQLQKALQKAVKNAPQIKVPAPKTKAATKKTTTKKTANATAMAVPMASTAAAPIQVNVYTGTVVDKRGLVDAVSSAVNEVAEQLGRPIKMAVEVA